MKTELEQLAESLKTIVEFVKVHMLEALVKPEIHAEFVALYNEYELIYNKLISQGLTGSEINRFIPAVEVEDHDLFTEWWQNRLKLRDQIGNDSADLN